MVRRTTSSAARRARSHNCTTVQALPMWQAQCSKEGGRHGDCQCGGHNARRAGKEAGMALPMWQARRCSKAGSGGEVIGLWQRHPHERSCSVRIMITPFENGLGPIQNLQYGRLAWTIPEWTKPFVIGAYSCSDRNRTTVQGNFDFATCNSAQKSAS